MRFISLHSTLALALFALCLPTPAGADQARPRMGIYAKVGTQIDLAVRFTDSSGTSVSLAELMKQNLPVILVPTFYECPRLCGLTINGLIALIDELPLKLGIDYRVIIFSFDDREAATLASQKKIAIESEITTTDPAGHGLNLLVGDKMSINQLTEQIGFRFRWADKELEHSSAIFILSPAGKLAGYVAGVEFPVKRVMTLIAKATSNI